jgi:hypothetical protein
MIEKGNLGLCRITEKLTATTDHLARKKSENIVLNANVGMKSTCIINQKMYVPNVVFIFSLETFLLLRKGRFYTS